MTPEAVRTSRGYIPTINPYRMFRGAVLPNWLMRRSEVSPMAKICYARLAQYAGKNGKAYPKISTLAKEMGIKERQAQNVIKELKDAWLIHVVLRRSNSRPSLYVFLEHPWQSMSDEPEILEDSDVGEDSLDEDPSRNIRQEVHVGESRPHATSYTPSRKDLRLRRESEEENQEERQEPSVLVGPARFAPQAARRPQEEDFRSARGPEPKSQTRKPGEGRPVSDRARVSRPVPAPSRQAPEPDAPEPVQDVRPAPTRAPGRPAASDPALQAAIEEAKKKAAAAAEAKLRRTRVREEKIKNLGGSVVPLGLGKGIQRIENTFREEMSIAMPGLTIALWDAQQRGQTKKLIEKYGTDLVVDAVKYVVRNWDAVQKHYFRGQGDIPNLGMLLKLHERIVPQAEQWAKHVGALDAYRSWMQKNADDPFPPEDLERAYVQAKQSLEKLGVVV